MNHYDDETRGTFQNAILGKQLVLFDGMNFKGRNGHMNVTPTDIDGLVQLDNENCVIFFELKHSGGMPTGQADALAKLCDLIDKGGAECTAIMAEHNTPCEEPIMVKDAIVRQVYYKGRWIKDKARRTVKESAECFVKYVHKLREEGK